MIELRWLRVQAVPGAGFESGNDKLMLQYRYVIPRHKGFVMQPGPTTGAAVEESDKWSQWITVEEHVESAEDEAA